MPDKFYTPVSVPRLSNNPTPADSGFVKIFATDDGRIFSKDAEGIENDLTNEDRLTALETRKKVIQSTSVVNRNLDEAFIVDPVRDSFVAYTVRTVSTISASVTPVSARLQISEDGVNFQTVASSENASLISLGGLLSISLLQDSSSQLSAMVPAGFNVRIETEGQIPPANVITITNAAETLFDISLR